MQADRFADAGATVALVARSKDPLDSLAGRLGGTAHAADLSDPAQVANLISRVEEQAGPVDVLVIRLTADVPREKVADNIVKAVQKNKRHVRLPRRGAGSAALVELPRRATEPVLTGVPHR